MSLHRRNVYYYSQHNRAGNKFKDFARHTSERAKAKNVDKNF
jgi:hypothetical protein